MPHQPNPLNFHQQQLQPSQQQQAIQRRNNFLPLHSGSSQLSGTDFSVVITDSNLPPLEANEIWSESPWSLPLAATCDGNNGDDASLHQQQQMQQQPEEQNHQSLQQSDQLQQLPYISFQPEEAQQIQGEELLNEHANINSAWQRHQKYVTLSFSHESSAAPPPIDGSGASIYLSSPPTLDGEGHCEHPQQTLIEPAALLASTTLNGLMTPVILQQVPSSPPPSSSPEGSNQMSSVPSPEQMLCDGIPSSNGLTLLAFHPGMIPLTWDAGTGDMFARVPLGEKGRMELKAAIRSALKDKPELREKVNAVAKLRCATIPQLLRIAAICGLWYLALNISRRFIEARNEKQQGRSNKRNSRGSDSGSGVSRRVMRNSRVYKSSSSQVFLEEECGMEQQAAHQQHMHVYQQQMSPQQLGLPQEQQYHGCDARASPEDLRMQFETLKNEGTMVNQRGAQSFVREPAQTASGFLEFSAGGNFLNHDHDESLCVQQRWDWDPTAALSFDPMGGWDATTTTAEGGNDAAFGDLMGNSSFDCLLSAQEPILDPFHQEQSLLEQWGGEGP